MKKLGPGVYEDGDGGLYVEASEFIKDCGYADTPDSRKAVVAACREIAEKRGIDFHLEN